MITWPITVQVSWPIITFWKIRACLQGIEYLNKCEFALYYDKLDQNILINPFVWIIKVKTLFFTFNISIKFELEVKSLKF